jgi:5-methylcytosine-specific restriction endonuclease McrA
MSVFVLGKSKKPLMPCTEKRARLLLERGRAVVVRMHPFTIRLKDRADGDVQPASVKLDPGSKVTGIAVVRDEEQVDTETGEVQQAVHVLWLAELTHRGHQISSSLTSRAAMRRRRRTSNLRYRKPRFDNRTRALGWLAPSLQHRIDTITSWVSRLQRLAPITAIIQELVRFDMQKMENPEISGVEYQQGALAGYECREYLLEKWNRKCAYCGVEDVPLQIEHIQPRNPKTGARGSDRISNLTLACAPCNQKKGNRPVAEFLAKKPDVLRKVLAKAKAPLRDAAAVNATRWALFNALKSTGLHVDTGSGGQTKFNRSRFGVPKTHALDAACVGRVDAIHGWGCPTLAIKATGRGSYQRTRLDRFGFPRGYLMRSKRVHGFGTGDMVFAIVPKGKKAGTHTGRVAVRASGSFNIQKPDGAVQGISHKYCRVVQRADGYGYSTNHTTLKGGVSTGLF